MERAKTQTQRNALVLSEVLEAVIFAAHRNTHPASVEDLLASAGSIRAETTSVSRACALLQNGAVGGRGGEEVVGEPLVAGARLRCLAQVEVAYAHW